MNRLQLIGQHCFVLDGFLVFLARFNFRIGVVDVFSEQTIDGFLR